MGRARVSRAGFGDPPKQSFLKLPIFPRNESKGKVRDREDALANTRDACATPATAARRDRSRSQQPLVPAPLLARPVFLCVTRAAGLLETQQDQPAQLRVISTHAPACRENPGK